MKNHKGIAHAEKMLVQCEFCLKKVSQHTLKMHVKEIHLSEGQSHQCSNCLKTFVRIANLKIHNCKSSENDKKATILSTKT